MSDYVTVRMMYVVRPSALWAVMVERAARGGAGAERNDKNGNKKKDNAAERNSWPSTLAPAARSRKKLPIAVRPTCLTTLTFYLTGSTQDAKASPATKQQCSTNLAENKRGESISGVLRNCVRYAVRSYILLAAVKVPVYIQQ